MKKLSKIFAVALCLAMVLAILPMGAAAAEEKYVDLTVDSMGVTSQAYGDGTATVDGVAIEWFHVGNYGDGIQMRDKESEGKGPSKIWNTAALGKITKIELTYSDSKSTYDNPDCMVWTFGNEAKGADYTTKLSTVAGTKSYTIIPEGDFSFFYLEWDYGYTSYWKSIKVYYTDAVVEEPTTPDVEEPTTPEVDKTADFTNPIAMAAVMVLALGAVVVIVSKKRYA